jgi:hypothetical protein
MEGYVSVAMAVKDMKGDSNEIRSNENGLSR